MAVFPDLPIQSPKIAGTVYTIYMTTEDGTFDVTDHDIRELSMKRKLKHIIAGTLLSACMGITYAGETPSILGSVPHQVLSQQAMASITVEGGGGSLAGGGVDSWRTNPPVSANGTKIGAGTEI